MARAYQESHILDNLSESVKKLQIQTTDLTKAKNLHEEKIKNLTNANEQLAKKNADLETRVKAKYIPHFLLSSSSHNKEDPANYSSSEHNPSARVQNAQIALLPNNAAHAPLIPLHDVGTNHKIRNFPKHEKDIRTMGAMEVIQMLQALDVKTLGMSAGEKKGELRAQVGVGRDDKKEEVKDGVVKDGVAKQWVLKH